VTGFQAFVLGVVQGITEFLPISSSGHLIIVPWMFGWDEVSDDEQFKHTFDVATNIGTLLAVVAYFWRDLLRMLGAWLGTLRRRSIATHDEKVAWLVVVASVPAAAAGALGEKFLESNFGQPWQIGILIAVFAILLGIADRRPETAAIDDLSMRHALGVGCAQALALMPGVSRSGITITAGRFLGLGRDAAARFSFLIYTPIVLGAVLYKAVKLPGEPLPDGWQTTFLLGITGAAIAGFAAIWGLLAYLRRHDYTPFVVYRLAVAALILSLIATGARDATL
jgi:undecaprenyl-diphosphatase